LSFKEQFIVEYRDASYIKDAWNEFVTTYYNPTYELQPFENYKMEFFGDGRLVCLRQISTDVRLREQSTLWGKYKDEDGTMADFLRLYLYSKRRRFRVYTNDTIVGYQKKNDY
jgi:hypothetical protein